jgi:hypothetical protein
MTKSKNKHHSDPPKVPKQATKSKTGSVKKTSESTSALIGEATKTLFGDIYGMASQYGQPCSQQSFFNPCLYNTQTQVPQPLSSSMQQPMTANIQQTDAQPPWVMELFKRLGVIESNLSSVDQKMSKLDAVEKKLGELQADISSVSEKVAALQTKYSAVADKTEGLDFEMTVTQKQLEYLVESNAALREEITDLKSRSMRDNLVFFNVPEEDESDTEEDLRKFIEEKMKMSTVEVDALKFERVHRAGPKLDHNRPRRIVAKFSSYKQREAVRALGKNLTGTNFFVHQQFPPEIVEQRKKLYPAMKKARDEGKTAYISYNKLYINGRLYHPRAHPASSPQAGCSATEGPMQKRSRQSSD